MSIRTKTVSVVAVTLIVLAVTLYAVLSGVLMAGFRSVEDDDVRRNVARVTDAIEAELMGIQRPLATWAQWDASYDFIQTRKPEFITENVSNALYTGMQVNFCVFVDEAASVAFSGGYDIASGRDIPVPPELLGLLTRGSPLLANNDPKAATRGIVRLKDSTLLVVVAPITDTAASARTRGHILFARFFDAAEVKRLSDTTHLAVSIERTDAAASDVAVTIQGEQLIRGSKVVSDAFGKPALRVSADVPRAIYHQARSSLRAVAIAIGAVGVLFGLVALLALELMVVRPIVGVSRQVTGITDSLDFSRQVAVSGNDEISHLARAINGLVCAVAEFLSATGANAK